MPDLRTNKSISERFDVEFNKRRESGLRRWRRVAAWVCVLGPLLLLGLYEVFGDGRAYWAGPLTSPHQAAFDATAKKGEDGCATCHSRMAQPLWRLVSGSRLACSVEDDRCVKCHPKNTRLGHSSLMVHDEILSCAICHEEHRGKVDLTAVSDSRCLACHADLRTTGDVHNFHAQVPSFAAHPEFAMSRFRGADTVAADESPGKDHGVFAKADLVGGKFADRTPLHFNHEAHLGRDGTLLVESTPTSEDAKQNITTDANNLRWKKLVCTDCHQTDAAGRYMAPIEYKKHCASCHPLAYSEELSGGGLGPLSHIELSKVFVESKARLLSFAQRQIQTPPSPSEDDAPRLPSKSRSGAAPTGTAEELATSLWNDQREVIKGGCAHCHLFQPTNKPGPDDDWAVAPPKIPTRWMTHARFNHDKHAGYSCVSCHDPRTVEKSQEEAFPFILGEDTRQERELVSRSTADILMPSVAICQKCHVSRGEAEWFKAGDECIQCHVYHPKSLGGKGR